MIGELSEYLNIIYQPRRQHSYDQNYFEVQP